MVSSAKRIQLIDNSGIVSLGLVLVLLALLLAVLVSIVVNLILVVLFNLVLLSVLLSRLLLLVLVSRWRRLLLGLVLLLLLGRLKQLLGLFVDRARDLRGSFDVVVALQEFVELVEAAAQVVCSHLPVLVKVEAHPVVLGGDEYIIVSVLHVLNDRALTLLDDLNEHTDVVARVVDEEHDLLVELAELVSNHHRLVLDRLVQFEVVHIWVRCLVSAALLHVLHALGALVEPQVDQVTGHKLELLHVVGRSGNLVLLVLLGCVILVLLLDLLLGVGVFAAVIHGALSGT